METQSSGVHRQTGDTGCSYRVDSTFHEKEKGKKVKKEIEYIKETRLAIIANEIL
jgi:hypothetical protein